MTRIAVIYHSDKGRTQSVAEDIARGVGSVDDCTATLVSVTDAVDWDMLHGMDALVFGCPTYMGSVSAAMKTFMDASSPAWMQQKWKNKLAAGFTNSYAASGDKLNVLVQLAVFAAQHGMVWIGQGEMQSGHGAEDINRLGSFLGLMTQSDGAGPSDGDRRTAYLFGARIANFARVHQKTLP